MAAALGDYPEYLLAVSQRLNPQSNRLELARSDGAHFLHDAYNSNPVGFRAALEVLAALPAARRLLMTPGMVERGPRQHEENFAAAAEAARICDLVLVVGEENRAALLAGLRSVESPPEVRPVATSADAFRELEGIMRPDDLVLV